MIGSVGAAALTAALVWAALELPAVAPLGTQVARRIGESGVSSEVTAVLLNFRGYDTLLEVGVLLLAVLAVRSLDSGRPNDAHHPLHMTPEQSQVLPWFVARLVPVAILVAGYLWWAGSSRPGGAFQAGAVLAAAGALLRMGGQMAVPDVGRLHWRILLSAGLTLFGAAAVMPLTAGGVLLEMPRQSAGLMIVMIEAALTISIGACLAALVVGTTPEASASQGGPT
jgi:multisubunit Na+/H+ antiporter MnhB subunit